MVVVHGLWSRRQALCLWVEHPAGADGEPLRTGPAPTAVVEGLHAASPALATALGARSRATVELALPTAAGGALTLAPRRVPVVVLNPDRAATVLAEVAALAASGPAGPAEPAQPQGLLADDLRYLADVAAVVTAKVAAGAVVPTLTQTDGAWWGRWAPLPDPAWARWRTGAASAMPPVLRAETPATPTPLSGRSALAVLDDLCAELTDCLVERSLTGGARHREEPVPTTAAAQGAVPAWIDALLRAAPVDGSHPVLADLAVRVRRWQASGAPAPVELLLRVSEPRPGHDADDAAAEDDDQAWTLQVRLRSLDDPSLVLTPDEARDGVGGVDWPLDVDPWAFAVTELGRAGAVYPPLLGAAGAAGARLDTPITAPALLDLVADGVPALVAAGFAVQLPGRWLRPTMSLKLHAQASLPALDGGAVPAGANDPGRVGARDLVEYSWKVALGDTELTEEELAQLVAAKSPLVALRGVWVQVDADRIARSLRFLQREGSGRAALGGLMSALSGALPEEVSEVRASGWLGELLAGTAGATITPVPAPAGLAATLRPYQERGLAWLSFMTSLGLGVVLADDMGLGKTLQLLALLAREREADLAEGGVGAPHSPTLLVCPMSVVGNWQREAAKFTPDLQVFVHHGPDRLHGQALAEAVAAADVVLTTYALVTRDAAELAAVPWRRVALDEAQHVKNAGTRAARAVRAVAGSPSPPAGTHRVALTGTPVENRLGELHSILDFTNPGLLGSAAGFRERFAVPIEKHRDAAATTRLTTITRPLVLRRVKTDPTVISDLPEKFEMVLRANLTAEQASLYQAVVDDMIEAIAASKGMERRGLVLAALTRLKQVCNHPAHYLSDGSPLLRRGSHRSGKLALVDDVLDSVVADGERALCFTQYREFGEMVAPHWAARYGTDVPFLHGGVGKRARDAMVERFSGGDGPPVLLLSLKAGGTGLNLVAANHVIHLDRWWNPAVEDQATDRAFRIGQTRGVQVRKLVCVGTVEERIDALMAAKAELADLVVGSGEGWLTELSTDDLRELFVLGADAVGD